MSYSLAPRGCYASDEFTVTFTDDNEVVVREVNTEYTHPSYGTVGIVSYRYENDVFVSEEWVAYDPNLVL